MTSIRIALRMLLRQPGFTTVAVLTLAVGIGANTAIFSVVDRTFLNPVPLSGHERMSTIRERAHNRWAGGVSPPVYAHIATLTNVFEAGIAYEHHHLALNAGDYPEMLWGYQVTPDFFDWFDTPPLLGRTFIAGEGRKNTEERIVLSERLWEETFQRDPAIIGREIRFAPYLDAPYKPYTVVGVMPDSFQFPNQGSGRHNNAFWTPRDIAHMATLGNARDRRMQYALMNWTTLVRRAEGVSEEQARAVLDTIAEQHRGKGLLKDSTVQLDIRPIKALFASEELLRTIWVVFGAVGFVLLIACANIGNLQLVRAETRQKEFAIRAALGASQWQVTRQLVVESLLIAGAGGALGLLIARSGVELIDRLLPPGLPRLTELAIDQRALGFTALLCLFSALVFGLAPAWRPLRSRLVTALKETGQTSHGTGREWMRKSLVATQVAMAVVLLTGAGLMVRSVSRLLAVDPGFDPDKLVYLSIFHLGEKNRGLDPTQREAWLNSLMGELGAIPGVKSIGLSQNADRQQLQLPGTLREIEVEHHYTGVGEHDHFETMGIRFLAGRPFNAADKSTDTVVINATLARTLWPDAPAVGQVFRSADGNRSHEVVGVVSDTVTYAYDQRILPVLYEPYARCERSSWTMLHLRTAIEPGQIVAGVRRRIHKFDAGIPPITPNIVASNLYQQTLAHRAYMWFLAVFAGVGVLLALIGIYGVVAYGVSRRTREFGIRMALGARLGDILRVVLLQGLKVTAFGILVGLAAANSLTAILASQLFEISPTDALVFTVVPTLMAIVSLLACLIPARRAAQIEPMEALRCE